MFGRKNAIQSRELLEYLAKTQFAQRKRLSEQLAAVDEKNAALKSTKSKLEKLLKDALAPDSYIDLDNLKKLPRIPAFNQKKPERQSYFPKPPSSFEMLIPWKKKAYDRQCEAAEAKYKKDRLSYNEALQAHHIQVAQEEQKVEEDNKDIEKYKQDFAAGKPTAIQNYFSLVLKNSAYPPNFPKKSIIVYSAKAAELRINFALPAMDIMPGAKTYKYDKIRDEIIQVIMPQKQRRRLYSSVLAQISLRTIYEIFTADRTNRVHSIVFNGYVDAINPSIGRPGRFCLVALNITRQQFDSLDLRGVEPQACLKGLDARLSSKPDQLLAAPPMTLDNPQNETVSDAAAISSSKRQISEPESAIQTQSTQITELERKLAARRDKNGELASTLRDKQAVIAELESRLEAQRDRIAELMPDLRDEQARNAELQVEIQGQKDYIAELESRLEAQNNDKAEPEAEQTETLDDTQPAEALTEFSAEDEFSEAGMFAPIVGDTVEDGAGGARIPLREGEQQAGGGTPKKPNLLEIMSVFVEAQGRYVDYIGEGLPKEQINRLVREGRLERHRFHTYKLRATLVGNTWYRERSKQQALPKRAPEVGAGGARIPLREPNAQANMHLAPHPKLLNIMSIIIQACQHGRFINYKRAALSEYQVNRLLQEGMLERSALNSYKLRPSPAGVEWYHKHRQRHDPPEPEPASHSPEVRHEAEKTITLGELLSGEVDTSDAADIKQHAPARTDRKAVKLLQRPAGTPDDLLTDLNELVTIMGEYGSETSRLIKTMAENNWGCNHHTLEAIFKQDENVTFANNIIDEINDRANETVDHPLIIEENDQWIIDEEFRDEIEYILKHAEYLGNS